MTPSGHSDGPRESLSGETRPPGVLLRFDYTNHRGEDHEYIVSPIQLVRPDAWWSLDANVWKRDGVERPGCRTFRLAGLRNVEDV